MPIHFKSYEFLETNKYVFMYTYHFPSDRLSVEVLPADLGWTPLWIYVGIESDGVLAKLF